MLRVVSCWPKLLRRKWSRKRAYDLVKTKNRGRKQSHKKGDGIGVGRTSQKVSIFFWLRLRSSKTRLSKSEAKAEGPITMHVLTISDWFSSSTFEANGKRQSLTDYKLFLYYMGCKLIPEDLYQLHCQRKPASRLKLFPCFQKKLPRILRYRNLSCMVRFQPGCVFQSSPI